MGIELQNMKPCSYCQHAIKKIKKKLVGMVLEPEETPVQQQLCSHAFPRNSLANENLLEHPKTALFPKKKIDMERRKAADTFGTSDRLDPRFSAPRIEEKSCRATGNQHQLAVRRPNDAVCTSLAASTWECATGINWQHNWDMLILKDG